MGCIFFYLFVSSVKIFSPAIAPNGTGLYAVLMYYAPKLIEKLPFGFVLFLKPRPNYYKLKNKSMKNDLQATNLKDRNGKEIHGGDVVRNYRTGNRYIIERFHSFDDWGISDGTSISNFFLENALTNLEIIGNIYENPELLEN